LSDIRELLQRGVAGFEPLPDAFERVLRRREQKRRNQRIGAGALAIILALGSFVALARAFRTAERPADEPTPRPQGIFSGVGGWIAYGNAAGIWAVNPTRPGDPEDQIQLSDRGGEPLAWSSDGSRLLIRRVGGKDGRPGVGLFILNADGTETRLTSDGFDTGGSFSSDGTHVVYAPSSLEFPSRIYVIDAEGGTPKMLLAASRRGLHAFGRRAILFMPTFSPDGTQVAFFAGWYDNSNSLVVMDADGSDLHVLLDDPLPGFIRHLVWSPDGTRLAFDIEDYGDTERTGIYVVHAAGSDVRLAIPGGSTPSWSPGGSRIAYQRIAGSATGTLEIANLDGTHVETFGYGGAGPWNPLPLSESGDRGPTAAPGGPASFVYTVVALGVVGVVVLAWRARRRTAST
jgi:dipeptidyl aminopeptidase/acylaminoacyl peptidase